MTTFYEQALPDIDWTNPLSGYLDVSVLAKGASGDNITELVNSATITAIDSGNASNGLVINNDGSISQLTDTLGYNINADAHLGCRASIPSIFTKSFSGKSFTYSFELDISSVGTSKPSKIIDIIFPALGNSFSIYQASYSTIIYFNYTAQSVSAINSFTPASGRYVFTTIYDDANNTFSLYVNGVLHNSITTTTKLSGNPYSAKLGFGHYNDKFYSSQLLTKTGSFTQAEIDSLVADPYQLFQTQQDVQEEYSLNFTLATHVLTIPFIGAYTGKITLTDNTTQAISGSGTYTLDGTTPINVKNIDATDTNGFHLFNLNKTFGDTVQSETSSLVAQLTGFPVDSGYVRDAATGLISGYQFSQGIFCSLLPIPNLSADFKIRGVINFTSTTSQRIYDLGASKWVGVFGNKFSFYIGSLHLQSTSQLSTGVDYVWSVTRVGSLITLSVNNEISTGSDTQTITVLSISRGSSAYFDGVFKGESTIEENGVLIANFDFTTGDQAKIIETISGNHAAISNDSTVKWQPIVPVEVSLVNANGLMDHTSVASAITSITNVSVINELRLYGELADTANYIMPNASQGTSSKSSKWVFSAGDNAFDGKLSTTFHLGAINVFKLLPRRYTDLIFRNIRAKNFSLQGYGYDNGEITLENVEVLCDGSYNQFLAQMSTNNVRVNAKNSRFSGFKTSIHGLTNYPSFYNCIIRNCGGYGGRQYAVYSETNLINCVIFNDTNAYKPSVPLIETGVTGSNNIAEDATAITAAVGAQDASIESYFDVDGTVTTLGQAAFKTQGWNGTDIVGWAYASAVALSAAISGTITTATEADIITGGNTIIITLTGDTWQAAGTSFDAQRQAIINGLVSAQSELTGWNNEVKAKELITSVIRTSDTVLTITLSSSASYNITASETITTTIPNAALTTSTSDVIGDITFTIIPTATGFKIVWAMNANKLIGAL